MPALVVVLSLLAAPAVNDEKRATALYEDGLKFYNVSDYGHAIEKFKAAYLIVEAPELLYNIAQAYRLWGGHCEAALQAYRSFVRVEPSSPRRPKVEQHIVELQKCLEPAPPPEAPAPIVIVKVREKRLVRPWVGPVVTGAAGIALALSGGALLGWVQRDWGRFVANGCAPSCNPGEAIDPKIRQTTAFVLLGAGATAVVGAFLWYLLGGRDVVVTPEEEVGGP